MRQKKITIRDVFRTVKEKDIEFIDLKFTDLFGSMLHLTIPVECFDQDIFREGIGFDASSVRGFQKIHESDMILKPDPSSMILDPFMDDPTLSFFCDISIPNTSKPYSRDPRGVAKRAELYLETSGLADSAFFGPELEFFIFEDVRFAQNTHSGFYHIDNKSAFWNTGRDEKPNLAYKPRQKGGYGVGLPNDSFHNLRSKMVKVLHSVGVESEIHHHEVASGGQMEIGIRFGTLLEMADRALKYKYVVKNVCKRYGKTATFMPKPLFQENGTGMHVHMSVWKRGVNLFYKDNGYAGLSDFAIHFIGGLLQHAPALCAICNPTTNSYRRLVPGYEAPINLVYSQNNRSACVRIPLYGSGPKSKRIEYRTPDPSCNPYLAFPALLMAGLDGVRKKLMPPKPIDEDIYEMESHELEQLMIRNTPGSLDEAIDALKEDHEFLLEGGVFTKDLIQQWIEIKSREEIDYIRLRPHPGEFSLYFDV